MSARERGREKEGREGDRRGREDEEGLGGRKRRGDGRAGDRVTYYCPQFRILVTSNLW
jgi:hypothetical protein